MKPFTCILLFLLTTSAFLGAQTDGSAVTLAHAESTGYYLVERSNWLRYDNGKYTGLTHRETRASVSCTGTTDKGSQYAGTFFVLEETLKDMTRTARAINDVVNSSFAITPSGIMVFAKDSGYPQLRSFPVYPAKPVRPGDSWIGEGTRVVDPKNNGKQSALPIMVEYRLVGTEQYNGQTIRRIKAKYATRLDTYRKKKTDDPDLSSASGTHDADIIVSAETGAVIMILDRLDETFAYGDGSTVRFKGNTALFTEVPVPIVREELVKDLRTKADEAGRTEATTPEQSGDHGQQNVITGGDTGIPPVKNPDNPSIAKAPIPESTGKNIVQPAEVPPKTPDTDEKPYTVEETPLGVRLSVRDIRFQADSDSILSQEAWRLDVLAKSLKGIPGGRFLIEGHTAAIGKSEGEKQLSILRAKRIVDELAKRGLDPAQFMYTGWGGTRPVAGNDTADGRAQNRRVEITILE
jgi:outer membrane protein OmpA-like peptidoglycan-associated protein